jgi:IclR family transcriptional regulator, acetate operon repressor
MSDTSVERAFAILETFERERRPLSMKEVAEACRIPASTCHSLVHALLGRAYLYQTGRRKDLYPTRRLYDLGATILANDPVLIRLEPAMQALREATRETVILGKRQKDRVIYLEVLESPEVIRYSARPGNTKPLHSTCIGKALLSTLEEAELHALLTQFALPRITAATIIEIDAILANIEAGRVQGCFVTRGENVPDVTAMAVPLAMNNDVYGLAVAGPSHRMDLREGEIRAALAASRDALLDRGVAGFS